VVQFEQRFFNRHRFSLRLFFLDAGSFLRRPRAEVSATPILFGYGLRLGFLALPFNEFALLFQSLSFKLFQ
jgi:hypothetical protein